MSMSYDERIGYAQKGEPEAICGLVFYCMYDHEDDMFEKRENEAKYWAKQLKALAVSGNLVAQEMIISCRSDFAKEVLCTGESVLEIQKLQQQYMDHIFSLAESGNADAIVSKSHLIFGLDVEMRRVELLKAAAELGNSRACEELSSYYLGGFTILHIDSLDSNVVQKINDQVKDEEKAQYYLKKGAECSDYYSYRCKYDLACSYYRMSIRNGLSNEEVSSLLDNYKYWIHRAVESGSLEAMEEEANLERKINNIVLIHPELNQKGYSHENNAQSKSEGCYVATCVYGSYDCPQVWVLRRYRDIILKKTWNGRTFIRFYYWIGPKAVRWFGQADWFHKICKSMIDQMVWKLIDVGFKDTPYQD